MSEENGGPSVCPICERAWIVTPDDDCLLPACGCYGQDTSAANASRPCETCGLAHAYAHRGEPVPPLRRLYLRKPS